MCLLLFFVSTVLFALFEVFIEDSTSVEKTYDYAPLPKGSDLKPKTHRGVIILSNMFMDGKAGLYLFKRNGKHFEMTVSQ